MALRGTRIVKGTVIAMVAAAMLLGASGCADVTEPAAPTESAEPAEPSTTPPSSVPAEVPAQPAGRAPASPAPAAPAAVGVAVASVTDGDTLRLADGRTVRLVQIDTPEVFGGAECGGAAASAALKAQLPAGARVRLVADPVSAATDRYGRLLRYVYRGPRNLNVWMVAQGHAAPYFYQGEEGRYAPQLLRAARQARTAGLGLWGACPQAILDARRGVTTGSQPGTGGASDAAAGAAQLGRLPAAPAFPPDVDCGDLPGPVRVTRDDPHRLDADGDGIGCD